MPEDIAAKDQPEKSAADQRPEPADDLATTSHTISAGGKELSYTATAGRIVLRTEGHTDDKFDGDQAKAEIFITSYVLDGGDASRPVTFAFNGGPGSSSVWLHMGLLGPRRVLTGDVGEMLPPPYGIGDNEQTLLAHSDLVFIDPVSTGYSRAVKGGKSGEFHGYTGDVESVGEVIRLWTTRNGRWMSPKYLCGESYGTTRAAALSQHLQQRYGMYLNGLMLISAFLDAGSVFFTPGNDDPYVNYLPTYAAIAHYHGKHGDRPLRDVLDEAQEYATIEYRRILGLGSRASAEEREAAVAKIASLTGLSADYVDRVDLRPEHVRFLTELLRDSRRTAGRIDGRFTGWASNYAKESYENDPSIDAITGPYAAVLNHYVRSELGVLQRPPLRGAHRPGAPLVVQGVRVQAPERGRAAVRGDADLPADARARGLRVLRRGDPVFRRRARHRAPGDPGRASRQHRVRLLRVRPHDVRPRAEQAGPVGATREVRDSPGLTRGRPTRAGPAKLHGCGSFGVRLSSQEG